MGGIADVWSAATWVMGFIYALALQRFVLVRECESTPDRGVCARGGAVVSARGRSSSTPEATWESSCALGAAARIRTGVGAAGCRVDECGSGAQGGSPSSRAQSSSRVAREGARKKIAFDLWPFSRVRPQITAVFASGTCLWLYGAVAVTQGRLHLTWPGVVRFDHPSAPAIRSRIMRKWSRGSAPWTRNPLMMKVGVARTPA